MLWFAITLFNCYFRRHVCLFLACRERQASIVLERYFRFEISPAFYCMHANCPNRYGNQSSFGRFRYYYVNYRTFARRQWPSCSDYDDVMLFLAECIRIFTTWQAIPFKRKFYHILFQVCYSH